MKKFNISQTQLILFNERIKKLEAVEFIGLCKLLKVEVMKNEKEPRDFLEMYNDLVINYATAKKSYRKKIDTILKAAVKAK